MKQLTTSLILTIVLLSGYRGSAQQYSLEDCLRLAMENNHSLKNAQLEVSSSEYRIKEVKSALLPTVNLTGQSLYYRDLPAQYAPASSFGGPEGAYNKLTLGMEQNTSANIQATQQLYNHSVTMGLKAAKVVREASDIQVEVTKENLVYNVSSTFYTIQVLEDNLQRLAENISNLEKTAAINENLKQNEIIAENLYNRILINLENLRNQYENQKLLLEKNSLALKYLLGLEPSSSLNVQPFNYDEVFAMPAANEIEQRADIRLQQSTLKLSTIDKKTIVAGYYPTVTNSFYFGYTGYNDSFKPFDAVNNDWIKTSYVALTVRIPVFDGFQKQNQIRQKDIAIQKHMNTLSLMKINAQREVEESTTNYRVNTNLLVNNKKSLDLAEQLFTSAQREYETGITSLADFLNAQNDLTNARTNYSTALLNVKLAELSMKKANGSLLTNP